ncbi:MAG TPA: DUF4012 domain-containing protein [bacterium]|nr:DUF4012 domain-containing protein [bacterium]
MRQEEDNNIIYSQEEPSQSNFLLDLRQQIEEVKEKPARKVRLFKIKKEKKEVVKKAEIKKTETKKTEVKKTEIKKTVVKLKNKSPRKHLKIKLVKPKTLKPILVLMGIFLAIVLPFKLIGYLQDLQSMKARVVNASSSGLSDLKSAGQLLANRDFLSASEKFGEASANFNQAREDLHNVQSWLWQLALVVPTSQTRLAASAPLVAQAGDLSGKLGNDLTVMADNLNKGLANEDLLATIKLLNQDSNQAFNDSRELSEVIEKINPTTLPQGYRQQLASWQTKLEVLEKTLEQTTYWSKASLEILGEKIDKRYLLVFQNNAEARASGGFVGSYALMDISQGKIKNLEIPEGGSYDTEGGLRRFVNPPAPLQLVDNYWKFWDANWWPDWPMSAKQLAWFLAESNGPTVDGVIAITPDLLEDLLKVTGPIDLTADHGLVVSSENFRTTVQDHVENKVSGEKQPKKVIGDLAMKIMEKLPESLKDQQNINLLLKTVSEQIASRHILCFFNDQDIQKSWEKLGWSGRLPELEKGQDYLQVVNTNIAGGKTDLRIRQTIEQKVEFQSDGSVINDVTVIREHTGEKSEGLYGVRNVDWLRLYVPEGSQLIEADGFNTPDQKYFKATDQIAEDLPAIKYGEGMARRDQDSGTLVYDELGRTVFANWSMIDPGQTAKLHFRYRLPFNLLDEQQANWLTKVRALLGLNKFGRYQMLLENQSGQKANTWKISWTWPEAWQLLWSSPETVENNWLINKVSNRQAAGLLFQIDK